MINKILCFLGFHNWTWKASDFKDEFENPDWKYHLKEGSPPPSFSKCKRCGERYGSR